MKLLSMNELSTELKNFIDTGVESEKLKQHKAAILLQDIEDKKKQKTFKEYFSLYENARRLEKNKDIDGALAIYLSILNKYTPEGSTYYERPCIILEKQKRYDEAIEICNLAITRAENYKLNFPLDDLKKRLERLIKKKNKVK